MSDGDAIMGMLPTVVALGILKKTTDTMLPTAKSNKVAARHKEKARRYLRI